MNYKNSNSIVIQLGSLILLVFYNLSCGQNSSFVSEFSSSVQPNMETAEDLKIKNARTSIVFFSNMGSGLCMDVPGSSLNNVELIQWSCNDDINQRFELRPSRVTNTYSIVSRVSGKCLDIKEASLLDGAAVIQYPCSGSSNQLFLIQSTTLGLQLIAQHSKKCIVVNDNLQNSVLVQRGCTNSSTDKRLYWSNSKVTITEPATSTDSSTTTPTTDSSTTTPTTSSGTTTTTTDSGTTPTTTSSGTTTTTTTTDSGTTTNVTTIAGTTTQSSSWKNFFAVAWHNSPEQHIRYAKQMGYEYIGINNLATPAHYSGIANRSGLKFYFIDPQYRQDYVFQGYFPLVKTSKIYTQTEKYFYNSNMAWKSTQTFPYNLASGWFWDAETFHVMWDFQQQRVVDMVVENIILSAKSFENKSIGFTFGGVIFDVPRLWGDFHLYNIGNSCTPDPLPFAFTNMSCWTGPSNSAVLHSGITHQYPNYPDGLAAFFKKLNVRMKQEFAGAKWIVEPMEPFNTNWAHADGWIEEITYRSDKLQLVPDLISQEAPGTGFVDDSRIFNAGLPITKTMMSTTQPLNDRSNSGNRLIAAKAGINGAWYNWFGRMGTMGQDTLESVAPSLKLIRALPNWDNLSSIPLTSRTWNGTAYQSPRSFANNDIIYSRHWKTGKIFVVFLTTNGVLRLRTGEIVSSSQRTDSYFVESGDGSADISIVGSEVRIKSSTNLNKGYIITVK